MFYIVLQENQSIRRILLFGWSMDKPFKNGLIFLKNDQKQKKAAKLSSSLDTYFSCLFFQVKFHVTDWSRKTSLKSPRMPLCYTRKINFKGKLINYINFLVISTTPFRLIWTTVNELQKWCESELQMARCYTTFVTGHRKFSPGFLVCHFQF